MENAKQKTVTKIEANPLLSQSKRANEVLNVAAYCRVSTDSEDQLNSYDAQVKYYTQYISRNPQWRLAGIYADEGISGTGVSKRESFKRLIRDCDKGKIDLVLTKSVSRFARNTVDSLNYIRKLKEKHIGVFFEEQNCNTLNEDSEMIIGLHSVIAQTESENISANIKWGIQKRMRDGTYACSFKLLGYEKVNGEIRIIPEEAEIVRALFRRYLDGYSLDQLKELLESEGVITRRGKAVWTKMAIRNMLSNEKYVGDVIYQKTFRTDCISKKVVQNRGERTRYLVSNNHPAIIDRDTFRLVQAETARRSNKRSRSDRCITEQGKYSGKYVLSELLFCGECGSPFRRRIKTEHGSQTAYWRCLNRMDHGKQACPHSRGIRESSLHDMICSALSAAVPERKEVFALILSNLKYALSGDKTTLDTYALEMNIRQLQTDADEIMKLWSSSEGNDSRYESEIEKLYNQIRSLREQLELSKAKAEEDLMVKSESERLAGLLETGIPVFNTFDESVIRRIVDRILVFHDGSLQIILKGGITLTQEAMR